VDRAPPGLIREDIVARYDKFCPKHDPALELHRWVRELESQIPEEDVIDRVRSRLQTAGAEDQLTLAYILGILLMNAERFDEAVPLFNRVMEQRPDHVRCVLAKAMVYAVHRDEAEMALELIDLALERAFRTRFYRREALGLKARILLKLRRGEELGQVLEQIMSLQMFYDARDTGRERDFVDRAPPGLIAADIVARYNEFCPKLDEV
jgi:tetratricopeptide (TPR) repeat protein